MEPSVGIFRVVQDVEIERFSTDEVFVVAASPIPRGERLLLDITDPEPTLTRTLLVRALENRVHIDNGALRWLVRLAMTRRPGEAALEPKAAQRAVTAIVRRVPIRLVEASTTGCRFQSPASIDVGTVGFIELRTAERLHSEALRVNRESRSRESIWPWEMAAEFLTIGPASPDSLRGVAAVIAVGNSTRPAAPTTPGHKTTTVS